MLFLKVLYHLNAVQAMIHMWYFETYQGVQKCILPPPPISLSVYLLACCQHYGKQLLNGLPWYSQHSWEMIQGTNGNIFARLRITIWTRDSFFFIRGVSINNSTENLWFFNEILRILYKETVETFDLGYAPDQHLDTSIVSCSSN